ncbi:MAG: hypothetical protein QW128_05275 [Thermoprotei archaeon]
MIKNYMDIYNEKVKNPIGKVFNGGYLMLDFNTIRIDSPRLNLGSMVVIASENILIVGVIKNHEIRIYYPEKIPSKVAISWKAYKEQYPDIENIMAVIYSAVSIGYFNGTNFVQGTPYKAPMMHDLVFEPDIDFIRDFHKDLQMEYIPLIYSSLNMNRVDFMQLVFNLYKWLSESKYFDKNELKELYKSSLRSLTTYGFIDIIPQYIKFIGSLFKE